MQNWHTNALQHLDIYLTTSDYTETQWGRKLNIAAKNAFTAEYNFTSGLTLTTTGDIEDWSISPDPSSNVDFVYFIALRSWCEDYLINLSRKASETALIRDGNSAVDTRGMARDANAVKTPCELFEEVYVNKYGSDFHRIRSEFANDRYTI